MSLAISDRKALALLCSIRTPSSRQILLLPNGETGSETNFLKERNHPVTYQSSTNLITREKRLHHFIKYQLHGAQCFVRTQQSLYSYKLPRFVGNKNIVLRSQQSANRPYREQDLRVCSLELNRRILKDLLNITLSSNPRSTSVLFLL
jgi:hypothetical protein